MRKLKFDGFITFIFIICIINLILTIAVLFLPEQETILKQSTQGNDNSSAPLPKPLTTNKEVI